jgi:hypothetical protein
VIRTFILLAGGPAWISVQVGAPGLPATLVVATGFVLAGYIITVGAGRELDSPPKSQRW